MGKNRKKVFDGLYAQLEETDGNVVLFSAGGNPSVIFGMVNPVQRLCTDAERYALFQDVLSNIVQTLGEGYALAEAGRTLPSGVPPRCAGQCRVPYQKLLQVL